MNIKDTIRTVPHWPIEGVMFRDITTLMQNPTAFRETCDQFYARYKDMEIDKVVGLQIGADDYITGLRYDLEVLSPLDDAGQYTDEAGKYAGRQIPAVNREINDDMAADGSLVKEDVIEHSYPHCWRCKKPVIYRATKQWFISMKNNDLRDKALKAIGEVQWTPAWGEQRIHGMVEGRPDWCVSRQRSWGVPLTVLSCADCGEILKDAKVCAQIEDMFEKEGADAWFKHEAAAFLPDGVQCSCGSTNFEKETDILDVWFDSGVSHAAVMEAREELRSPADLYLEGSDQHRGWFHSSLLTAVGLRGAAPYRSVLTHGFVVDADDAGALGEIPVEAERLPGARFECLGD